VQVEVGLKLNKYMKINDIFNTTFGFAYILPNCGLKQPSIV